MNILHRAKFLTEVVAEIVEEEANFLQHKSWDSNLRSFYVEIFFGLDKSLNFISPSNSGLLNYLWNTFILANESCVHVPENYIKNYVKNRELVVYNSVSRIKNERLH